VIIRGEARSHNMAKLEQVSSDIRHAVEAAVKRHHLPQGSATYDWQCKREYDSFQIAEDEPVVKLAMAALAELGIECDPISGGGGSDANIINAAGIPTIITGTGMNKVHTVNEDILVSELEKGAEFIETMIKIHSK